MLASPARINTLTGRSTATGPCFALLAETTGPVVGAVGAVGAVEAVLVSDATIGPARPVQLVMRAASSAASTPLPIRTNAAPSSTGQRTLDCAGRGFGCPPGSPRSSRSTCD